MDSRYVNKVVAARGRENYIESTDKSGTHFIQVSDMEMGREKRDSFLVPRAWWPEIYLNLQEGWWNAASHHLISIEIRLNINPPSDVESGSGKGAYEHAV